MAYNSFSVDSEEGERRGRRGEGREEVFVSRGGWKKKRFTSHFLTFFKQNIGVFYNAFPFTFHSRAYAFSLSFGSFNLVFPLFSCLFEGVSPPSQEGGLSSAVLD